MNSTHRSAIAALALAAGAAALIAGPLTPPAGPVASTYKTLSEVEPRIPVGPTTTPGDINNLYRITQPGSYYLTGNITTGPKTGVSIESSGVTFDLGGFEIADLAPAGGQTRFGVKVGVGLRNVCVRNGMIRNINSDGVRCQAEGARLERLSVSFCQGNGIYADAPSTVESCTATNCGQDGFELIAAVVRQCGSSLNGARGFFNTQSGVMTECVASDNTGSGFELLGGQISHCTSSGNTYGVNAAGAQVLECAVSGNNSGGIRVSDGCTVRGNQVDAVAGFAGILTSGSQNRIEGNRTHNGSMGIQVSGGSDNFVAGNICYSATTPFSVPAAGNMLGPIVTVNGTISSTSPFANFAR